MTGAYTFKRFVPPEGDDHWSTPPGHWCAWNGGEIVKFGEPAIPRLFVLLTCPACKLWATLPHQVDAQGRVHPSVVCPHPPCPMHLMPVTLEGWDFGPRASQG